MYRMRTVVKLTPEGWPGAIETFARINDVAKQRGWQQGSVWTQTFGPLNELSFELEYADMATYERETAAFYADEEAMKLVLAGTKYRRPDDPGYNDCWQRVDEDG